MQAVQEAISSFIRWVEIGGDHLLACVKSDILPHEFRSHLKV